MSGIAIAAEAYVPLAVLACLSLLLLALGSWLGRWPVWLAGWIVALLALAVAFIFRAPDPPAGLPAGEAQRSAPAGVVDFAAVPVAPIPRRGEAASRCGEDSVKEVDS